MNNQQKFYTKQRDRKKRILVCMQEEKIKLVIKKLLEPVAEIIICDNFGCVLKYEEEVEYKKNPIDLVFTGILMEGIDGFLIMKDIKMFEKNQKVCSFSKKGEDELFNIMFPKNFHIDLPLNLDKFFEVCLEMDI